MRRSRQRTDAVVRQKLRTAATTGKSHAATTGGVPSPDVVNNIQADDGLKRARDPVALKGVARERLPPFWSARWCREIRPPVLPANAYCPQAVTAGRRAAVRAQRSPCLQIPV